jgi:hypothetical protein
LGAKSIQSAAGELEKALRENIANSKLEGLHARFAEQLTAVVEGLRGALGAEPENLAAPAAPVGIARLPELVSQMLKFLSEFDAAAADHCANHRALFASLFSPSDFSQFEQHLQAYSFTDALGLLESAARARGIARTQ